MKMNIVSCLLSKLNEDYPQQQSLGSYISNELQFESLLQLLPVESDDNSPAIYSSTLCILYTHRDIKKFITNQFNLREFNLQCNDRVGILLPNGTELGLCLIATCCYCTCVPMNSSSTIDEIKNDIEVLKVKALIIDTDIVNVEQLKTTVLLLRLKRAAETFKLEIVSNSGAIASCISKNALNGPQDTCLLLQTSGTTGKKKTVSYNLKTLIISSLCVAFSWQLTSTDCNLNMMPLFHIGGIVRNLFAPLLTGGSVILCKAFDPNLFWDILETSQCPVTWYYAGPTMHFAILQIKESRQKSENDSEIHLRMICNAAGGLLPSLAQKLHQTFGTVILPCYGMTECMPISCPPINYQLNRLGTSGIACGPEIQIFDDNGQPLTETNRTGRIFVRGPPLFDGYENVPTASTFTVNGWFDTGDMGYLDDDKFLYINGRTKEVINRGGEIISPFEIEEAVVGNPRVRQALAFAVEHDILQETIGLVLVPFNPTSRIGLIELHKFLSNSLHPSKWPQLIVYMNDLPKNQMNKPLRIGLAQRLQLKELKDSDPVNGRLYEATAPPTTAPSDSLISCQNVKFDTEQIYTVFNSHPLIVDIELVMPVAYVVISELLEKEAIWEYLDKYLHDYLRPKDITILKEIPRDSANNVLLQLLPSINAAAEHQQPKSPIEIVLVKIFREISNLNDDTQTLLNSETDFFQIGGNSLKAGTLFNKIRRELGVTLPVMTIYSHRTIGSLRTLIEEQNPNTVITLADQQQQQNDAANSRHSIMIDGAADKSTISVKSKSQTRPIVLLVQSLPLLLLRPVRMSLQWFLFIVILIELGEHWKADERWKQVLQFVIAILSARLLLNLIVYPAFSFSVKWLIIGRYRRGHYPLWGEYYLRWWFVDQTIRVFGFGVFEWHSGLRILFLRLMGTKIGKHVRIDPKTQIKEFDIVTIKSNVKIQRCVISPFTFSSGYMILAPIRIRNNCSIGLNTRLSPGATVTDGTQLGPLSSSYEMNTTAATEQEPKLSTPATLNFVFQLLFGWPVILVVTVLSYIPWIASIYLLFGQVLISGTNHFIAVIYYFANGKRVAYHILAVIARDIIRPFVYIACCILVKRLIIGKFKEHEQGQEQESTHKTNIRRQIHLLKHWLMKELLPGGDLNGFAYLVGTHYELISVVYRLLGARIGKRIYWPGSGLHTYEYDLLTIGDDVVFGSRSFFLCSNDEKTLSKRISIKSGSMIADRCVLLPGVTIEENTIMGSGSLGKENSTYPAGSIWIGSKQGNAVLWNHGEGRESALKAETITPFGRAFYEGEETGYWVMPLWLHVIYNLGLNIFLSVLWATPMMASIQLIALVLKEESKTSSHTIVQIGAYTFFLLIVFVSFFYTTIAFLTILLEILFKWLLFGRRQPGEYNWDQSSYCQRWQLYITIQRLKRNLLQMIRGSAYICAYYRCLGCHIGRNVCLYPTGADPMMSEPDLVTIGDDCCIDDASIICHLNSKGQFSLHPLVIGNRCVLRSQSRLMSGASMEDDSTLLEHTLIVSGDTTEEGTIWQGWPATDVTKEFRGQRISRETEYRHFMRISSQIEYRDSMRISNQSEYRKSIWDRDRISDGTCSVWNRTERKSARFQPVEE